MNASSDWEDETCESIKVSFFGAVADFFLVVVVEEDGTGFERALAFALAIVEVTSTKDKMRTEVGSFRFLPWLVAKIRSCGDPLVWLRP